MELNKNYNMDCIEGLKKIYNMDCIEGLNKIYNMDCIEGLKKIEDNTIDLILTSPPYDNLRTYDNTCEWNFDIFKNVANELYRVLKKGGIIVWIVGDATINGGETGTSFKQALYFQSIGLKIHDTMIYEKNGSAFPAARTSKRYTQIFEYMFVFTKDKIRNDILLIADKKNKWAGCTNWGEKTQYDRNGNLKKTGNNKPIPEYSL
jgi:site-specific DNA-methyltransferase (adenine-specific)